MKLMIERSQYQIHFQNLAVTSQALIKYHIYKMIKTHGQSIAANKSKPNQQQMDEVRIQIIRQINNNPNYSKLTIEEKKQLVEQKMNIREIKSNKNIIAQHSDNINKKEDEKGSDNLKLAIKRLSTNLKIEKRAFSKVKEDIRRNEKLSSDKHIDKIKKSY